MFWRNCEGKHHKKKQKKKTSKKLSLKPKSFSSLHLFSWWKEGIYVSLGKCFLSSLLPTHGCDLWEHSFFFPTRNMSSGTSCVCVCVCVCVCAHSVPAHVFLAGVCLCVQCVLPWGGTCSGTAEWEWPWPNPSHFVLSNAPPVTLWSCSSRWRACLPACLPRMCSCVSESARFTHVTTVEATGALSCFAKGLRRAAARWLLKGLCLLHAWRGWRHSWALEHGAQGFT